MNKMIADEILDEGIGVLYEKLGSAKTIKFFQLLGVPKGDSVSELREKTKELSKREVLNLIKKTQKEKQELWGKIGLI